MASYTGHGHYISGMPRLTAPTQRKNCGGPELCLECANDVIRVIDGMRNQIFFSNPAGVVTKKVKSLMSEPTPEVVAEGEKHINVFNKAVNAIHELGHEASAAEAIVVKLLKSGIVLRDVNEADADVAKVDRVVDEAAPVLEAAEPTLAPEIESVQQAADETTKVTDTASADAKEFINEVNPPAEPKTVTLSEALKNM